MELYKKIKPLLLVFSCFVLSQVNAQNLAIHMEHVNNIIPRMKLSTKELMKNSESLNSLTLQLEEKASEITKIVGVPPKSISKEADSIVKPEHIAKLKEYEEAVIDLLARSERDPESRLVNTFIPVLEKMKEYGGFLQNTLNSEEPRKKVVQAMTGIEQPEPVQEEPEDLEEKEEEEEPEEEAEPEIEEPEEEEAEPETEEPKEEQKIEEKKKEEPEAPMAEPAKTTEPEEKEIQEEELPEPTTEIPEEPETEEEEMGVPTDTELKDILEERTPTEKDIVNVPMEALI